MSFFQKKSVVTEKRIVLPNVTWQKLEEIVVELGPDRAVHLTYDAGKLELMTPLELHRRGDRLLESLLLVVADDDKGAAAALEEGAEPADGGGVSSATISTLPSARRD